MIIGIGLDMIEIERIDKLLKRQPKALNRFLTPREQELLAGKSLTRQTEFVAGRYAAKEAGAKALGTGIGEGVSFLDMEVLPAPGGKPEMRFDAAVYSRVGLDAAQVRVHLSITHSQSHAVAQVVLEKL